MEEGVLGLFNCYKWYRGLHELPMGGQRKTQIILEAR